MDMRIHFLQRCIQYCQMYFIKLALHRLKIMSRMGEKSEEKEN